MRKFILPILSLVGLFVVAPSYGLEYKLPPPGEDIVGRVQRVSSEPDDDLHSIGRRFDMGYFELVEANRQYRNLTHLSPWTDITIPSRFILPAGPREGLVINLAELRIYYYPKGSGTVITEPIGIGREGWLLPQVNMRIIQKQKDPQWFVPKSVLEWAASEGRYLPDVVEPGPDNPLGRYSLRLSHREFLIHGTNQPLGVGMRSSSGCIRMFPEDIKRLYELVDVGTKVRIINEPFKVGRYNGEFYLEVHQPLQEDIEANEGSVDFTRMVEAVLKRASKKAKINWDLAEVTTEKQTGIPTRISE